ncbi:hypothetical protein DTO169E5_8505 [Paecilomyces variotii]|nr:hypothetical protein DTO169E5_8505 [Paecilomyces variotii]
MHCATVGTVISLFEASTKVAGTFYQDRNQIREDQGGSGPFDIVVSGVTAIGKAILGQAEWDSVEVTAELFFFLL